MQLVFANIFTIVALASATLQGLGIKCHDGGNCTKNGAIADIAKYMERLQIDRMHYRNRFIACRGRNGNIAGATDPYGSVCGFLQGTKTGFNGSQIKSLTAALVQYGCNACGSISVDFPNSDDPAHGYLTFDWISYNLNPCPNGVCKKDHGNPL